MAKLTFSGHESFACRSLWLKKGYELLKNGGSFNNPDAVITLGVGKNMVSSIRFWLKAFNIIELDDTITLFGHKLLADDGWDAYLEDEATLWLLHYQLVKKEFATSYNLIFNELRKSKIEFSKESFIKYVTQKYKDNSSFKGTENTVGDDFDVFAKLYIADNSSKDKEDIIGGILTELNLVKKTKRDKDMLYLIQDSNCENLPPELLLYAIAENENYGQSISLHTVANDKNSLGAIFAINQSGIVSKLDILTQKYSDIIYKDDAGIKEIQFKANKPNPFDILDTYYNAN